MWTPWNTGPLAAMTARLGRMAVSEDAQHIRFKRSFLASVCWFSLLLSLTVAWLSGSQQPVLTAFFLQLALWAAGLRITIAMKPHSMEAVTRLTLWCCLLQGGILYLLLPGWAPRSGGLLLLIAATFFLNGRSSGDRMLWLLLALVLGNHALTGWTPDTSLLDSLSVCLWLLAQWYVVRNYERLREIQTNHLKALNTDLEAQIQQRTEQLAAAKTALEVEKENLKTLSSRDHLTGLFNRQYFESLFLAHLRQGHQKANDALMLIDIDYFKKINDTHGHLVGDAVLKAVAQCLRKHIRISDIAVRWGGDELMVYAPRTSGKQAAKLAEKIRLQIVQLQVAEVERLTISVGVAALQPGEQLAQLLNRADLALYQAKQAGRNAVFLASDPSA